MSWRINEISVLKVFVSYAIEDLDSFSIPRIVTELEKYPTIEKVYYWNRDCDSSITIPEYMEKKVEMCDLVLIFCSKLSMNSTAVSSEIKMAEENRKKIIPIFHDFKEVREDLRKYRGVKLGKRNFDDFLADLYLIITGGEIPSRKPEVLNVFQKIKSHEWHGVKRKLAFNDIEHVSFNKLLAGIFDRYILVMEKSKSSGTDFWCTRKYLAKKGMEPLFLFDYLYGGGSESLKTYGILFIESFSESIKKSETICQDLLTGIQKIYQSLQDVTHFYDQCKNCGANYGSYQEFINQECPYCGYKALIKS